MIMVIMLSEGKLVPSPGSAEWKIGGRESVWIYCTFAQIATKYWLVWYNFGEFNWGTGRQILSIVCGGCQIIFRSYWTADIKPSESLYDILWIIPLGGHSYKGRRAPFWNDLIYF